MIILPTIGRDLSIPESRLQWIVSAYALTFGTFLLLWGRIADSKHLPDLVVSILGVAYIPVYYCMSMLTLDGGVVYGKRDIFIWGSAFVAVTLIANPFLPNEIAFDLFRGLQGLV